jgi:hypothetical protein
VATNWPRPTASALLRCDIVTLTIRLTQLLERLSDRLDREAWLRDRGVLVVPKRVPPVRTPAKSDQDE